jgi:hypothetical protein
MKLSISCSRAVAILFGGLAFSGSLLPINHPQSRLHSAQGKKRGRARFAHLPLRFEANSRTGG